MKLVKISDKDKVYVNAEEVAGLEPSKQNPDYTVIYTKAAASINTELSVEEVLKRLSE